MKILDFNSHAHVERDLRAEIGDRRRCHFNSHAHVERDDTDKYPTQTMTDFNSHAHVERDLLSPRFKPAVSNFNSHAHVERDFEPKPAICLGELISTHTLTWSVTLDVVYIWCLLNVMRTYFFI